MSTPLEIAEAALKKVHDAEMHVGSLPPSPPPPVEPEASGATSTYLGHIGEPAVKGKDFE